MADFLPAFKLSMLNAGAYVNDPDDPGGETYRDISRKYNPKWEGWSRIDALKKNGPLKKNFVDEQLDKLAAQFYKVKFWDQLALDSLKNQELANLYFDQTLDGIGRTIQMVQKSIGAELTGKWSAELTSKINSLDAGTVFNKFKDLRLKRFRYAGGDLPSSDPDYSFFAKFGKPPVTGPKYLKGWLNRVNKYVFSGKVAAVAIGSSGIIIAAVLLFLVLKKK